MVKKGGIGCLGFVVLFCLASVIYANFNPVKPSKVAVARPTTLARPKPIARPTATPRATPKPKPTSKPLFYGIRVTGRYATVQTVGAPTVMTLHLVNTGNVGYPVTFDLSGCSDHWAVDKMSAPFGDIQPSDQGDRLAGWLERGKSFSVSILLAPKDVGRHVCDIALYRTQDTATNIPIGDPLATLSANVAINPA